MATEAKIDPFTLAAIMGHANLRTIMRYVHPQQEQKKRAMERYESAMKRKQLRKVIGRRLLIHVVPSWHNQTATFFTLKQHTTAQNPDRRD